MWREVLVWEFHPLVFPMFLNVSKWTTNVRMRLFYGDVLDLLNCDTITQVWQSCFEFLNSLLKWSEVLAYVRKKEDRPVHNAFYFRLVSFGGKILSWFYRKLRKIIYYGNFRIIQCAGTLLRLIHTVSSANSRGRICLGSSAGHLRKSDITKNRDLTLGEILFLKILQRRWFFLHAW